MDTAPGSTISDTYSTLERSTNEIRILRLEPGHGIEDIRGTLEVVPIDLAPDYEALSYAWGSSVKSQTIVLDDCPFSVTENLHIALKYLRSPQSVRILWIDAVCINQSDNSERLHQVQMMAEIYKRANVVLIWLGAPRNETDEAIDVIQYIARTWKFDAQDFPTNAAALENTRAWLFDTNRLSAVISNLLNRSYWYRVWVVQELAIPRSEPLVGCGFKWISWSALCLGLVKLKWVLRMIRESKSCMTTFDELQFYKKFDLLRHSVFDMNTIRKLIQPGFLHDSRLQHFGIKRNTNILDLLWRTRIKECSDPRDRIFSLLGLFQWMKGQESLGLLVSADYTSSLRSIYSEVTVMTIELEGNLEILNMKDHRPVSYLPSWTPNFSSSVAKRFPALSNSPLVPWIKHLACRYDHHFFKWRSTRPTGSDRKNLDELTVWGRAFDSIRVVVDMEDIDTDLFSCIRKVYEVCFPRTNEPQMQEFLGHDNFYLIDAIWRTLVADFSDTSGSPCPSSHGNLYKQILKGDMSGVEPFLFDVRRALYHVPDGARRRFFVSQRGSFGLGPPDCTIDDLLCVFERFSMPAVLRRNGDFYTYFGTAYVHGAMAGEEWPMDDTDLDKFVLR